MIDQTSLTGREKLRVTWLCIDVGGKDINGHIRTREPDYFRFFSKETSKTPSKTSRRYFQGK